TDVADSFHLFVHAHDHRRNAVLIANFSSTRSDSSPVELKIRSQVVTDHNGTNFTLGRSCQQTFTLLQVVDCVRIMPEDARIYWLPGWLM
ncbi:MAG: hypothetical protein WCL27_07410, partial [Betaproteobacteria bacterium]